MSYTKRQFIIMAFEEIGLSEANYTLQDAQLNLALKRLDSMMTTWNSKGIRLSYPIPSDPSKSSLDTNTNVPDRGNEAIYLNLAIRIAPAFGKQVSPDLRADANKSYKDLLSSDVGNTTPPNRSLQGLPVGAGAKSKDRTFIPVPDGNVIQTGSDGDLILEP